MLSDRLYIIYTLSTSHTNLFIIYLFIYLKYFKTVALQGTYNLEQKQVIMTSSFVYFKKRGERLKVPMALFFYYSHVGHFEFYIDSKIKQSNSVKQNAFLILCTCPCLYQFTLLICNCLYMEKNTFINETI